MLVIALALLSGCGGASLSTEADVSRIRQGQQATLTVTDYYDVTQKIYLSYFGRPADAGGLNFYATQLLANKAPNDVVGLSNAYFSNPAVKAIIDSFSNSKESAELYPGTSSEFLDAVYLYLFNRGADASGKNFWLSGIDGGRLSRASAALFIMAGAQGSDLDIISAKVRVSGIFTAALDTEQKARGYAGMDAIVKVRSMLGKISEKTDPSTYRSTVDATLTDLVNTLANAPASKVEALIASRCAACHAAPPAAPGAPAAPALLPQLDSAAQIVANAPAIYRSVVQTRSMPPQDAVPMSDEERNLINQWYLAGPK
ncbi:DUF4214 domain-containing protein [Pseudoduganella danionis]|uniref:DUF4214 domain-containing protein n=1 Tax=Pseudoduganella danionis TaxID=1890295 RepID=UPI0035B2939C